MNKTSLALTTLVVAGLATSQPAAAASLYSITDLGSLNPTATGFDAGSFGYGINDSGQVVGSSVIAGGYSHAFRTAPNSAINPVTDDLGTLGGNNSTAYGINNSGQVVGDSHTGNYNSGGRPYYHAFLYSNGRMQDLGTLGGQESYAYGINDSGQVVGYSDTSQQPPDYNIPISHAFLYSNGRMQDLGTLSGQFSNASDINDSGQVVGTADTASGDNHAFLYNERGPLQDLGTLGGQESTAFGINDSGQVVGAAETGATYQSDDAKSGVNPISHAFLYNGSGPLQDLGTLGGPTSTAYDINNFGEVIGTADTPDGLGSAFIYSEGKMTDLNSLIPNSSEWLLSEATGINNAGQIVGTGTLQSDTLSYPVHAFLLTPVSETSSELTPVPEPASGLGILAFGALGAALRLLHK